MKKNESNKLTIIRIFLSLIIIFLLAMPWYKFNISWSSYMFGGKVLIEFNYIVAAILLIIFLLMYFANRKSIMASNYGKILNSISYKVLINGLLITFAYNKNISVLIPLIVIIRDIFVTSVSLNTKVLVIDKVSRVLMILGILLVLVGNIPFEFLNLAIDQGIILIATCLSVYSGCEYFLIYKYKLEDEK